MARQVAYAEGTLRDLEGDLVSRATGRSCCTARGGVSVPAPKR